MMHVSRAGVTSMYSNGVMVRLADGVVIRIAAGDALIEHRDRTALILPGEGARLRTLAGLLHTARPEGWLRQALMHAHPQSPADDLLRYLTEEGVLVPWDFGSRLADLHQQTIPVSEWIAGSPAVETERHLREYAGEGALALPPPERVDIRLVDALASRRTARQFSGQSMKINQLASLLALGCGSGADDPTMPPIPFVLGGPPARRTYPSGGALYPIETLVYPLHVDNIDPGFYYYQVLPNRLLPVASMLPLEALVELLGDHPIEEASCLMLFFMDFARPSLGKYGEKAYRLALLEAGHIVQNVLLVATGLGLAGLPLCGFYDEELSLRANLAYPYEAIVYVLVLGTPLNARSDFVPRSLLYETGAGMNNLEFEKIANNPTARIENYKRLVRSYYNCVTDIYRQVWGDSYHFAFFSGAETRTEALLATERLVAEEGGFRPGIEVLDVGCGPGGPALTIAEHSGAHITGVDIVEQHIATARKRAAERALSDRTKFELADAMNMPFPAESFDHVYVFEAGCHMPDKAMFYRECARVLRPGGLFLGMDWMCKDALTPDEEVKYIEPICLYHAVPQLISLRELSQYLIAAGLDILKLEDWSAQGTFMRNWEPLDRKIIERIQSMAPNSPALRLVAGGGRALVEAARAGVFIVGYWCARKPGATQFI